MNENHSRHELIYRKHWLTPNLQAAITEHAVVVLTGARQVGKSTLIHHAEPMKSWRYHTLDDFDVLRQVERDPSALWAGTDAVVIDEVQKAPHLLPAIKQAVDRRKRAVRFVLSGSANLLLMKQVSESLAGRAVYFTLLPMTVGESEGTPALTLLADLLAGRWPAEGTIQLKIADPLPLLLRGFMPPLLELSQPSAWTRWWQGYIATYLERDLRQISQVVALTDFRRVMELAALRTGQLLNQTELARDARLAQPTVHRYLNLIEATHLAQRVPAFMASHTTRLIKSPKLHWADPALAIFLSGYYDVESLAHARELGAYFETLIYQHVQALAQLLTPQPRIFYWRTQRGEEVDFVVEQGRRMLAIEVKMTSQARYTDADGLTAFLREHPKAIGGVLVYMGSEIRRLSDNIVAVPWECWAH